MQNGTGNGTNKDKQAWLDILIKLVYTSTAEYATDTHRKEGTWHDMALKGHNMV